MRKTFQFVVIGVALFALTRCEAAGDPLIMDCETVSGELTC
jgi:hypothetical protein